MKLSKILTYICSLLILISSILWVIDFTAMDATFYQKTQKKYDVSYVTGLDENQLAEIMDVLLEYIAGKQDNLDYQLTFAGDTAAKEVFNQKEKDHMVDVQQLYLTMKTVLIGMTITIGVLIIYLIYCYKNSFLLVFGKSYNMVSIGFLLFLLVIGLFALTDFDTFWTTFHQIFFHNDLWLLNPYTDVLIQLVPGELFNDLVNKILIQILIFFGGSNLVFFLYQSYKKRQFIKKEGAK